MKDVLIKWLEIAACDEQMPIRKITDVFHSHMDDTIGISVRELEVYICSHLVNENWNTEGGFLETSNTPLQHL